AEPKRNGRRFVFRPLWFIAALAILGSASAATGVVLTGNVSGLITATASQSLLVREGSITGADAQLGTVNDEMTQFTASARRYVTAR
ncbi:MAG: hypothetical protein O3B84_03275, partial [Chloroflexi bacterium]|nr:hypothetical protein [Chloroflexota bacterium]